MIINPIIPIWVMVIICIFLLIMKRKGGAAFVRQIFIVILIFVINLRPMVPNGDVTMVEPKVDVLFVVDNTISMIAEDYGPENKTRLEAVKADCRYIMEKIPGANYSVYAFNKEVEQMIPYTPDYYAVAVSIDLCNGGSRYHSTGTDLEHVLDSMEDILNTERESYKVVFFISDGEIVSGDPLGSYPQLKEYVDNGAVLGYGTESGGKMKPVEWYEEEDEVRYLEYYDSNYNTQTAISVIDEDNLRSIAGDLGVEYVHMTSNDRVDKVLEQIQEEMLTLEPMKDTESKEGYTDIYFWFAIPLVILLVIDCISYKRNV